VEIPPFFIYQKYIDDNIGAPVTSELLSYDCSISTLTTEDNIPVVFLRVIFAVFVPLIFFGGIACGYLIALLFK
jgi:hypothetical protein